MIRVSVDHSRRTRFVILEDFIDDIQILETYKEIIADPDFDQTYNHFVDLTRVDHFNVTTQGVRDLADLFKPNLGEYPSKLALVAPKIHIYGMARMYQSFRANTQRQVRVFRTAEEAYSWLGITPHAEEPPPR